MRENRALCLKYWSRGPVLCFILHTLGASFLCGRFPTHDRLELLFLVVVVRIQLPTRHYWRDDCLIHLVTRLAWKRFDITSTYIVISVSSKRISAPRCKCHSLFSLNHQKTQTVFMFCIISKIELLIENIQKQNSYFNLNIVPEICPKCIEQSVQQKWFF